MEQIKFMYSKFMDNWSIDISPDIDTKGTFKKLYLDLNDNLKLSKRNFIFIIDSDNWSYVDNEFKHLFSFRPI